MGPALAVQREGALGTVTCQAEMSADGLYILV